MSSIAVIGDTESILGFKVLGFDVYPTHDAEVARHVLHQLANDLVAIILVTEPLGLLLKADIRQYDERLSPAIILIPAASGSLGLGVEQITTRVKRAVGMDLLKEKSEVTP